MAKLPPNFFYDPKEELRGILGQGYVASVVSGQGLGKGIMVLSDRRLYQKGKIFEKDPKRGWVTSAGEKTIAVKDITGTSFFQMNPIHYIVMMVVTLPFALWALAAAKTTPGGSNAAEALSYILHGGCLAFYVLYQVGRKRLFVVHYAGGEIATSCRWYPIEEIEEFQRIISLEKDRIEEERETRSD